MAESSKSSTSTQRLFYPDDPSPGKHRVALQGDEKALVMAEAIVRPGHG
jgi:hypothetical protein